MKVCKEVTFSGRVQGVGFRDTARRIAGHFDVGGYVKNLRNGNVELVAEGEADEVKNFIESVQDNMSSYIDNSEEADRELENFAGFEIRF